MSENLHTRALQLVGKARVEGLADSERDWLNTHLFRRNARKQLFKLGERVKVKRAPTLVTKFPLPGKNSAF